MNHILYLNIFFLIIRLIDPQFILTIGNLFLFCGSFRYISKYNYYIVSQEEVAAYLIIRVVSLSDIYLNSKTKNKTKIDLNLTFASSSNVCLKYHR